MQGRVEAEEQVGLEVAGVVEAELVDDLPFKTMYRSFQSRIDDRRNDEQDASVLSASGDAGSELATTKPRWTLV